MTIFEADWICPVSSPPICNGWLSVNNGRILGLGPLPLGEGSREAAGEGSHRISFRGCAIIPGFVNAHAHLELTILRGFLEDLPFATWIPRLSRTKYQQLTRDEIRLSARLGAVEMLAAGVTCVGEVMDLGTSWEAMREFGLRGIAYQEIFGPADAQMEEALAGLQNKIETYRHDDDSETRCIGVSPHAPYTVSAKLYQAVNDYAQRQGLRLTTHVGESTEEGLLLRHGSGPVAERLRERGIAVAPQGLHTETTYDFSPSAQELLDELLPLTVRSAMFQAFLDATTSEHVARMVALATALQSDSLPSSAGIAAPSHASRPRRGS